MINGSNLTFFIILTKIKRRKKTIKDFNPVLKRTDF